MFCDVIAGSAPSKVVLTTDHVYAFRDISPVAPVHVLVVPREHIADAGELTPDHGDVLAEMMVTAQKVAEMEGIAESGYRLVFNIGEDALQSVDHLHMHVIGGRRMGWPPG